MHGRGSPPQPNFGVASDVPRVYWDHEVERIDEACEYARHNSLGRLSRPAARRRQSPVAGLRSRGQMTAFPS